MALVHMAQVKPAAWRLADLNWAFAAKPANKIDMKMNNFFMVKYI
jgi:hypothetical protein